MQDSIGDLGASGENTEPLYVAAAKRFKSPGEDLDSFLARNREYIENSTFPGPNCLHPDELCEYRRTLKLPPSSAEHLATCQACAAMVQATKPSDERVLAFRAAVAAVNAQGERNFGAVSADLGKRPMRWLRASALSTTVMWVMVAIFVLARMGQSPFKQISQTVTDDRNVALKGNGAELKHDPSNVVVTAQLSNSPVSDRPMVRTPAITVTANTSEIATTVAATAAVLTQLHSVDVAARKQDPSAPASTVTTCSTPSANCQDLVASYATLLSDYLQAEKTNQPVTVDMNKWFERYVATHPEKVLSLEAASKSGRPGDSTSMDQMIVPTLEKASLFYAETSERLGNRQPIGKDISLRWMIEPDITLNVKLANGSVAKDAATKSAFDKSKVVLDEPFTRKTQH